MMCGTNKQTKTGAIGDLPQNSFSNNLSERSQLLKTLKKNRKNCFKLTPKLGSKQCTETKYLGTTLSNFAFQFCLITKSADT